MAARAELLWRLLPGVRPRERSRFLFFAGLFTLISLAQTLGLAGTEALFLARFGAARLPPTFVAAALFTVVGSMLYAIRVGEVRNDLIFMRMLIVSALMLAAGTVALAAGRVGVLPGLFCAWYGTQAIFNNHFWTFSADYFDTQTSKRLFPLFTVGSSLGGVLGGALAAGVTGLVGPVSLIGAWATVLLGAALLLRAARRPLRRWGPLELEEADETSVAGLRGAVSYLRTSSLARWLVLSALGMVTSFFLAQFLYSDIFARSFPDPSQLALFLSVYFAITNVIEILFEVALTPWLIRRIGVPGANLIHPVLMLLSFAGVALRFGVVSGLGARMARELMDNAMGQPVRSLMQNAMPARLQGRMRAFLEGIVVYAGMAFAGAVLLAIRNPEPLWLCAAGGAAALFYLLANWRARRAYLRTLIEQLRSGRLDLAGVRGAIGGWEASRLAELWEQGLRDEGRRPSAALLQLIPALAARGILDPLVRAASHPSADVRRASVSALASTGSSTAAGPLALALDDPEPGVRLAALRGLARVGRDRGFLSARVADLLRDLDPRVRAEAARQAGPPGFEILTKMIASPYAAEAIAALAVAPPLLLEDVLERTRGPDPAVRAAALECAARLASEPPFAAEEILGLLREPDSRVRGAALLLAANSGEEACTAAVAAHLSDPSPDVRHRAETVLGSLGAEGAAAAEPYLEAESERAAEAALRVVAASQVPEQRALLSDQLRRRVRRLWYDLVALQLLPADDGVAARLLRVAYRDALLRERRLAFRILELLENPSVIHRVDRELRVGSSRSRSAALEVLSNLGDREAANLLALIHETGPLEERAALLGGVVDLPASAFEAVAVARGSELRWLRAAAIAIDPQEGDPPPEEDTMQRLLALKQLDLFANLSLEQLDAVHQAAREVEFVSGEVIFEQNDPGDLLYVLLEGCVDIVKNRGTPHQLHLATCRPVAYFGEMAILADERRSATAVAREHSRLLTLDGLSLKELILHMPEISFEIFRMLTGRIRAAESRLGGA